MAQEHLRDELVGALIGLARTCDTNPPTDQTEGLLLAGLHLSDPEVQASDEQLRRLIDRVHADKALVSPNCMNCASPCGKNFDYDMSRMDAADDAVREAKLVLLDNLRTLGHRGRMSQLVYDGLFALAEDWDAEAFGWYISESAKAAREELSNNAFAAQTVVTD